MTQFTRISCVQAAELLQQDVSIVDIRDPNSYHAGHVQDAFHLTNETLPLFIDETAKETPVLVMCYHGNSSQGVANYLASLGYQAVYSIDGGFESWKLAFPYVAS